MAIEGGTKEKGQDLRWRLDLLPLKKALRAARSPQRSLAMEIKSLSAIREKWTRVTPGRTQDYSLITLKVKASRQAWSALLRKVVWLKYKSFFDRTPRQPGLALRLWIISQSRGFGKSPFP
ncbi:hypothetical protein ES703_15925 [subsurface metagenome]